MLRMDFGQNRFVWMLLSVEAHSVHSYKDLASFSLSTICETHCVVCQKAHFSNHPHMFVVRVRPTKFTSPLSLIFCNTNTKKSERAAQPMCHAGGDLWAKPPVLVLIFLVTSGYVGLHFGLGKKSHIEEEASNMNACTTHSASVASVATESYG